MAHVAKYTLSALGHMLNHYSRQENDGVKRGNQEIKPELTHKNWNVAEKLQPLSQMDFIHQRLSQVKVQKRADVNIMCDWVVTLPQNVPERKKCEFFQQSFRFLCNRYGKENVISAWVHEDETTPHMHFSFIPVTANKKKGGFKVSAKEVLTRKDLQTFHSDLQKHLETALNIPVGILNHATVDGNQTIAELKRQTAIKRVDQAEKQAVKAEKDLRDKKEEIQQTQAELEKLNKKTENLTEKLDSLLKLETSTEEMAHKATKKSGFLGKNPTVTMSQSDFDVLLKQAQTYIAHREDLLDLRRAWDRVSSEGALAELYEKRAERESLEAHNKLLKADDWMRMAESKLREAELKANSDEYMRETIRSRDEAVRQLDKMREKYKPMSEELRKSEERYSHVLTELSQIKLEHQVEIKEIEEKNQQEITEKNKEIEKLNKAVMGLKKVRNGFWGALAILRHFENENLTDEQRLFLKAVEEYSLERIINGNEIRKKLDFDLPDSFKEVLRRLENDELEHSEQEEQEQEHNSHGSMGRR